MSLDDNKITTVAVFWGRSVNSNVESVLRGVEDCASEKGVRLVNFFLIPTFSRKKARKKALDYIHMDSLTNSSSQTLKFDAYIFYTSELINYYSHGGFDNFLSKRNKPYCLIGRYKKGRYPSVYMNNHKAMEELLRHFFEVHKTGKIYYFHPVSLNPDYIERRLAFKEICRKNEFGNIEYINLTRDFEKQAYNHCKMIDDPLDGNSLFITPGIDVSRAVFQFCSDYNIAVPQQLALASFGAQAETALLDSPLTIIDLPYHQLGREALLKLLGGRSGPVMMKASLIVRNPVVV